MKYKKFDKNLHDQWDELGRNAVIEFFRQRGHICKSNTDKYGVDLILYRNEEPIGYAEVEVKPNWDNHKWPFKTVNVPSRKRKLLENDLPTWFFCVNNKGDYVMAVDAETVLNSPLLENPNKYIASGEYFYKVPVEKAKGMWVDREKTKLDV